MPRLLWAGSFGTLEFVSAEEELKALGLGLSGRGDPSFLVCAYTYI